MSYASLEPVGSWLGGSFRLLKSRWVTLTSLFLFGFFAITLGALFVYGLGVAFAGFFQGWDKLGRILGDPLKLRYFLQETQGITAVLNLLVAFIALRIYCRILRAAIHASSDESVGFRDALKMSKRRDYAFLALVVVQQVMLQAGMILFLLPGIALAVFFGFAPWAFARQDAGIVQSLKDSAGMIKGHFLGVLGRMLLVGLIGSLMMLVPVIGWLIGGAWILTAWGMLYKNLRGVQRQTTPVAVAAIPVDLSFEAGQGTAQ